MQIFLSRVRTVITASALLLSVLAPAGATNYSNIPADHASQGPLVHVASAPIQNPRAMFDILYEKEITKQGNTLHYKATDMGTYNSKEQFVEYLTVAYGKASEYVWTEGFEVSAQIQAGIEVEVTDGITATLGASTQLVQQAGVSITIPADSSRDSRLAVCADFFVQKFHYQYWLNGKLVTNNTTAENKYPVKIYLRVAYA